MNFVPMTIIPFKPVMKEGEKVDKKRRIVFIGDSITEAGRLEDQEKIGTGYVRLLHDYLQTSYPNSFEVLNKGVSGDRVIDLAKRWENDVLRNNPDILSISIGVNDVWHQLKHRDVKQVYPADFERVYDEILLQAKTQTNAQLVLMEPTIIEEDVHSIGNQKLMAYVEIVRHLADKYQAILVPTHQRFMDFLATNSEYALTTDGVHMNSAGNMLIATSWLKSVRSILR